MKKLLMLFCLLFAIAAPLSAFAAPSEYQIIKYHVDMVVNTDNTFDITETIMANFSVPKHGIYRTIPLKNTIARLDGTKSTNRAIISDIQVSEPYTLSTEDGNKKIKIGNSGKTLTGSKAYTIRYKYDIGRDPGKDYDELYYNLIGNEWDTTISNFTFKITMPNDNWLQEKLGFSTGLVGSTSSNVKYEVTGNVISGSVASTLNVGYGVNVRLELPEGYFDAAQDNTNPFTFPLLFGLPVLFVLVSFYLWNKYGKDDKVIETVEFYPPEGFNSAEVGFLYKGSADNKDICSLLVYLANKGYIKIEEYQEKNVLFQTSKNSFKFIKLKEYDGDNENEKMFLNGLFSNKRLSLTANFKRAVDSIKGPIAEEDNGSDLEVTRSDLYKFYITLRRISADLNSRENKRRLFEDSVGKGLVFLMTLVAFVLITIPSMLVFDEVNLIIPALVFPGGGFLILFFALFGKTTMFQKIGGLICGGWFGGMPLFFIVMPVLIIEPIYLAVYVVGMLSVLIMMLFFKFMSKRTPYGNEMLGKLRGFKNFLELAEKDKLEELVADDPEYFYNILPFTYVLGVSDKWIKKFESIALQAPDWYSGHDAFSAATFGAFMTTTMASATSAMCSTPRGGSGGGSGGGSSGGGSGGGGGGSW
jgi:uncharacterized membrane protein